LIGKESDFTMTEIQQIKTTTNLNVPQKIGDWLTGMNIYIFFLIIFLYHVLVIFQGIDFNDEGFHLAFYQQIFKNPESVQYAFWGWLSGIVGGSFMKLFPFLGMWGIRFLGAIVSTATIIIAYNLLKKYLHNGYLKVSMIMLSLFINEDAKNLYYNNLSAFLYFAVAYFIFVGLRDHRKWMIFTAGVIVGLNIFTRLPNLLGVGLIVSIFYYGYINKESIRSIVIRSCFFLAGTVVACLLVFAVMKSLNHFSYFMESIKMISTSSNGAKKDDGLDGAYGITNLLKINFDDYKSALRFLMLISLPILMIGVINNFTRNAPKILRLAVQVLNYALVLGAFLLAFRGWFTSFRLLEFFTGISLLSSIVLFEKNTKHDLKLLTIIGGLILLIHPFGSSAGIATVVVYSMWIAFPVAIDFIIRLDWTNLELRINSSIGNTSLKSDFTVRAFNNLKWVIISAISLGCLYNVIKYPYLCDYHNRWQMRYSVDNKFTKGIYTSKGRVDDLNELLTASSKYIKPNDIVLAYDCMPLYHFMTETRSYVRNPCIWFYTTELFRNELDYAESHQSLLPVIVRQLIKTTGEGSAWPEVKPPENYLTFKRTQAKNNILNDFIKKHNYKEVWNNGDFTILIPPQ
jgi:Dolichyl-phosphate-mannose-protein mannosyltransferase